eukprot:gene14904-31646_t
MGWLHPELKFPLYRTSKSCYLAAKHFMVDLKSSRELYCDGSIQFLQWAFDEGFPFTNKDVDLCRFASQGGSFDILMWGRSQDPPYKWDLSISSTAAIGGHMNVLKWIKSQDPPCPWGTYTCTAAAKGGHLKLLKWLVSQDPPCPFDGSACAYFAARVVDGMANHTVGKLQVEAASEGHLDTLKWLRSQNPPCSFDGRTCFKAAQGGHLETLKWLRSLDPPCPWESGVRYMCCSCWWRSSGDIEIVKIPRPTLSMGSAGMFKSCSSEGIAMDKISRDPPTTQFLEFVI